MDEITILETLRKELGAEAFERLCIAIGRFDMLHKQQPEQPKAEPELEDMVCCGGVKVPPYGHCPYCGEPNFP